MRYRAIAFDLGGVLLDSEEAHESAARRIVAMFRLTVPDVYWHRIRGVAYEDFYAYVLALPANRSIRAPAVELVGKAYDFYYEEVRHRARLFPNAIEVIELARRMFDFVAIVTSSEWRLVDATLRHFDLSARFDSVIAGDHLTQKKPAPEAFLVTAWLLGIRPGSMIVVEDSAHGIRAARLARARAIGIATSKAPEELVAAGARYVARDHYELTRMLQAIGEAGAIGPGSPIGS
jgi:HAD superfamily hydrolase (TIGR01509 family)